MQGVFEGLRWLLENITKLTRKRKSNNLPPTTENRTEEKMCKFNAGFGYKTSYILNVSLCAVQELEKHIFCKKI